MRRKVVNRQCSHCSAEFNPSTIKGAVHLASCRVYQGHANYETWAVALWIDNEEGSHRYWRRVAESIRDEITDCNPSSVLTVDEKIRFDLADALKEEIGDSCGEHVSGLAADLMNGALSEVAWDDIARDLIEGLK